MKVWRLRNNNKLLEVWEVDEDTKEIMAAARLELTAPMSKAEAETWAESHRKLIASTKEIVSPNS